MQTLRSAALSLTVFVFFLATSAWSEPRAHAAAQAPTGSASAADIARNPADLPPPIGSRAPAVEQVNLTVEELKGQLDPNSGTTYEYWTFNGKVPGPLIRVRQGDTVEVTLRNAAGNQMPHSIDLHAAQGPGGGAGMSLVAPGETRTFTFQAAIPGLFVYHCGTPMVAQHVANGMYGLILVEPPGGLPPVGTVIVQRRRGCLPQARAREVRGAGVEGFTVHAGQFGGC